MARLIKQHAIAAALALIIFLTALPFIQSIMFYVNEEGPAYEWFSARVLTPVVRPGETLKFEYTRIHRHQCPADLRRYIVRPADDEILVRFPVITGGGRLPEEKPKTVEFEAVIPPMMDNNKPWVSGEYIYRMTAVRFCNNSIEYDTKVPDVRFTLKVEP